MVSNLTAGCCGSYSNGVKACVRDLRSEGPENGQWGPIRSAFRERVPRGWSEERSKEDAAQGSALQRPGRCGDPERARCLPKGSAVLPGPPKPLSVAELSQDSTALSTLGTAGEKRAVSCPPLSASGGSSSASLGSLKLPDL